MKAEQSNSVLALNGFEIGTRCPRPDSFRVEAAWATAHYSFQLDSSQQIGRRISSLDTNPDIYFRLIPVHTSRSLPRNVPSHRFRQAARTALLVTASAAAFLILYPFYPAAQYQVQKQVAATVSHTTALAATPAVVSAVNRVIIPKIGVDSAVLEGKSLAVLNKADGIWHETGVETSNIVLAGHRFKYLPPNATTLYNLDKVEVGDTVVLDWYHKRYIYVVTGTETVTKTDIGIRNPSPTPTLTIYSCEEKNQAHRIVVHAKLIQ